MKEGGSSFSICMFSSYPPTHAPYCYLAGHSLNFSTKQPLNSKANSASPHRAVLGASWHFFFFFVAYLCISHVVLEIVLCPLYSQAQPTPILSSPWMHSVGYIEHKKLTCGGHLRLQRDCSSWSSRPWETACPRGSRRSRRHGCLWHRTSLIAGRASTCCEKG